MPEAAPPTAVRLAVAADAAALGGIARRAWAAIYPGIVPPAVLDEWIGSAEANWHAAFEDRDPAGAGRIWIAEVAGRMLGYATTSPARSNWLPPPDGAGELTNLYLEPDAIGTGVGRTLYEHAIGDMRERGFDPIVVWAFRENARALRFYERMGLAIDIHHHDWILGEVPCPIVRFRSRAPRDERA